MIDIGSIPSRSCAGISRRALLKIGALAPFVPASVLAQAAEGARRAPARSILLVWLWGGPSHLDTFDPKPQAPLEYRGPFGTIATRMPGIRFGELLPQIAARNDRFSLVRSNRNLSADHLVGGSIALTGAAQTASGYPPNFGSIVARHHGDGSLPSFISMARGRIADGRAPMDGHGGGTWGSAYDPFLLSCSAEGKVEVPALQLLQNLTLPRLSCRKELLTALDATRRKLESAENSKWSGRYERAYDLITSPAAREALDLSAEAPGTRQQYGHTSFGQSCLLARRLVEAGVPYIQVNWSQYVEVGPPPYGFGWDTHAHHFSLMADRHLPIFDRAFSALLDDLWDRGLLDSTLVVCLGEFGRTPKINHLASRDHWPDCYCSIWAGAGVAAGRVIGQSDARGEQPVTEPVFPAMVGATMLELAGIGSAARAQLKVLPQGRVIHELL